MKANNFKKMKQVGKSTMIMYSQMKMLMTHKWKA